MRTNEGICFLLLLLTVFCGCDTDSGTETAGRGVKGKLWALPLRQDSLFSSSDSIGFSLVGNEVEKYRLWNNCFSFFGKEPVDDLFGNGAHFDSIASASTDTLVLTHPGVGNSVRYLELANRCLDKNLIATLELEGGFEDKVYADSDSVRFRFSFSIRPDVKIHDFNLILYGQMDNSNETFFTISHSISELHGTFDTTISIGDLPDQWKITDAGYIKHGIAYFRSDRESPWVNDGGKRRVTSIFE